MPKKIVTDDDAVNAMYWFQDAVSERVEKLHAGRITKKAEKEADRATKKLFKLLTGEAPDKYQIDEILNRET
jgi:hypothetical protein